MWGRAAGGGKALDPVHGIVQILKETLEEFFGEAIGIELGRHERLIGIIEEIAGPIRSLGSAASPFKVT